MIMEDQEQELLGWDDLFGELNTILQAAQRQFGVTNEQYTRYTIEGFEVCVQSLALLLDNLDHPQVYLDDNERASLVTIHSNIGELLTCCRTLPPTALLS